MFKRENFTSYNGQNRGDELINEWKYVTSDGVADVISADYFKDVQQLLAVGDIIHVYVVAAEEVSGGASWYRMSYDVCVRSSEEGHVAALPIGELSGQGVLVNGTSGNTGTIGMGVGYTLYAAYCILSGKVSSGSNAIAVKNGSTTLYSGSVTAATGDGAVIALTKNGSASAALFDAASFGISAGGAAAAAGTITVVLNAAPTVAED